MPAGLNQDRPDSESDDGCDAAVLQINRDKQTIEFASAKLGLFQVNAQGVLTRHLGSRCSLCYSDAVRRLEEILKVNFKASAEEITAAMKSEFAAWQGTNARRDDVTAVVFRL